MTQSEMEEVARGNIERHLGDVTTDYDHEEDAADAIYDGAYTLGFNALTGAGVDPRTAGQVASSVAQLFAQP